MVDTGKVLNKVINFFGSDIIRINHLLKVYGFAQTIAANEGIDQQTKNVIEITAILHDVGIKISEEKYNSSAGHYQEIEGPAVAEDLLMEFNLEDEIVDRVKYIIGHHHTYDNIKGIDYQIVVEADFLVNSFEDSISNEANKSIIEKIFKTDTGKKFFGDLYLDK